MSTTVKEMVNEIKTVKQIVEDIRIEKIQKEKAYQERLEQERIKEVNASVRRSVDTLISEFERTAFKLTDSDEKVALYISQDYHIITYKRLDNILLRGHDSIYIDWKKNLEHRFGFELSFREVDKYIDGSDGNYSIEYGGIEAKFNI